MRHLWLYGKHRPADKTQDNGGRDLLCLTRDWDTPHLHCLLVLLIFLLLLLILLLFLMFFFSLSSSSNCPSSSSSFPSSSSSSSSSSRWSPMSPKPSSVQWPCQNVWLTWYSTVQYSTVQYSTVQYSTVDLDTMHQLHHQTMPKVLLH